MIYCYFQDFTDQWGFIFNLKPPLSVWTLPEESNFRSQSTAATLPSGVPQHHDLYDHDDPRPVFYPTRVATPATPPGDSFTSHTFKGPDESGEIKTEKKKGYYNIHQ